MRSLIKKFQFACLLTIIVLSPVNGSPYWQITNQMKLETRPYTKTHKDPSTTGPTFHSGRDMVLQTKFREMRRYCDGQCFYGPSTCVSEEDKEGSMANCRIAASIAMHNEDKNGELYCDFFGSDNLRQSFCSSDEPQTTYRENQEETKYDQFYTVTLHRVLDNRLAGSESEYACKEHWNERTGRKCRRTEFIGISFLNTEAPDDDLHEDDLWYICTVDEYHKSRVTMWTQITMNMSNSVEHVLGTKPHLESGAGVVFSKVDFDEDALSMGCQFTIQESNMTLLYPPKNAAFFNDKSEPIRIKIGTGVVERSLSDDDLVRPFYAEEGKFSYNVYRGDNLKPTNKIFFESLKVDLVDPVPDPEAELLAEEKSAEAFDELLEMCNKPLHFPGSHIACYPPNFQQNCIYTGRCPIMLIVEVPKHDVTFKTIKVHLYSLLPDYKSLRKVDRPNGYASVGFSLDDKMGRDVVITCHADGVNRLGVYVSINYEKTNVYPGNVNYSNLIYNTKQYATVNTSRIFCSWEMETKFVVNMFDYEPDYRQIIDPGISEKLEFDFTKEPVFLLVAAGNRNYPNGKIVHHDFRQVLKEKFNRKMFFEKAKGNRLEPCFYVLLFITTVAIIIVTL